MRMGLTLIISLIILGIFFCLSAFFSGSETAITSLDEYEVEKMKRERWKNAEEIARLKNDPERTLTAILIGNNLVNVAASALATFIAVRAFGSAGVGIATGIVTLFILVFGEITPKTFCVTHSKKISSKIAKPLLFIRWIFYPLSIALRGITGSILSLLGTQREDEEMSEKDLKLMVAMGGKKGTIKNIEKKLIHNVFELDDISVMRIMVSRLGIECLEAGQKIEGVVEFLKETIYSRIPIYRENKDNMIGVLLVKEALKEENRDKSLEEVSEEPMYFHPSITIDEALRRFQKGRTHLAIVKEKDQVLGIVTLEDVIEEIVGEIEDETDKKAREL